MFKEAGWEVEGTEMVRLGDGQKEHAGGSTPHQLPVKQGRERGVCWGLLCIRPEVAYRSTTLHKGVSQKRVVTHHLCGVSLMILLLVDPFSQQEITLPLVCHLHKQAQANSSGAAHRWTLESPWLQVAHRHV